MIPLTEEKLENSISGPAHKGILSVRRLASILELSIGDLEKLANEAARHYNPFDRRKIQGIGKWRHIDNPDDFLKSIQARIQRRILTQHPLPDRMVGGVAGRSIVDHAKYHVRQPVVALLDIRECFPSISHKRIFNVYRSKLECSTDVGSILTKLTSFQHRLPQGAPTSPAIANLALLDLFSEIADLSIKLGLEYSLYVDDIAISGPRATMGIEPISRLIKKHGLRMAWRKVKVLPSNRPQEITGLQVNRGIDISSEKINQLKSDIYILANSPLVYQRQLKSIQGRISNIKYINPIQGSLLEDLARHYLPDVGLDGGSKKSETRECTRFGRNHSG